MALSSRRWTSRSYREDECTVVERDPTGQYARYDTMIEHYHTVARFGNYIFTNALKQVYKGFDGVNGREIIWSKLIFTYDTHYIDPLCVEANLLQKLDHKNVMKSYYYIKNNSNIDGNIHVNTITQLTSGNLRVYTKKNAVKGTTAIKNWCRQILEGLDYLHKCNQPMIHGNLVCENTYVLGRSGRVKVGVGLGDVMILEPGSKIEGNPDAEAAERDEIYCFGMCVVQMVARDVTVIFDDLVMINRKLGKIRDPQLRDFICFCLSDSPPRVSEVLHHPFLEPDTVASGLSVNVPGGPSTSSEEARAALEAGTILEKEVAVKKDNKKFVLQGKMVGGWRELVTMTCSCVRVSEVEFEFSLKSDTVQGVVELILVPKIGQLTVDDLRFTYWMMGEMVKEFRDIISDYWLGKYVVLGDRVN